MQENNKRNKEIITIKVLASAAVLNLLAAGFTLMYSKNQNKEIETKPTRIATQANPIYNEINDNSKYMSAINQNILYDIDPSLKQPVNPPYIPGTAGTTPAPTENNVAAPKPTLGPPYKPGLTEDDLYTDSRAVPIPDEIATKNPIYNEITNGTIPAPVENNVAAPKPTLGPPYKPGLTEDDLYTNSRTVPIPNEIAAKNPIYNEITNGTIPAPTEISAESMVRESQNPVYNEIKGNSEYITTINKDILYDLDPSIKPPVNPPYKPNEDSDEHTRSI